MSRSEEARKETKLDKDIPEDILFSYTVLFAFYYKILNFFSVRTNYLKLPISLRFTESANRFWEVNQISHFFDHFCENINVVFISGKMERELGSKTCLVFLYFSKAFNCLLPNLFLGKLNMNLWVEGGGVISALDLVFLVSLLMVRFFYPFHLV